MRNEKMEKRKQTYRRVRKHGDGEIERRDKEDELNNC